LGRNPVSIGKPAEFIQKLGFSKLVEQRAGFQECFFDQ
jgi:hypothetical protein